MVYGIGGKFGIVSDAESATCRTQIRSLGSNPTLTANLESITYKETAIFVGNGSQVVYRASEQTLGGGIFTVAKSVRLHIHRQR